MLLMAYLILLFNMIASINEPEILGKHISCDCKCKLGRTTYYSNQKRNNDKCQCQCKRYHTCKKDYSWNPSTYICENGKCLKSTVDKSVISCDGIIMLQVVYVANTVNVNVTNTVWYQQLLRVLCQ